MSLNKVQIIGGLGTAPEFSYTPSGTPVCKLSVGTTEYMKGAGGQPAQKTAWHRVTVWGKQAENCSKYLGKGSKVYLEGRLEYRSWTDQKTGDKRFSTDIVAQQVVFLSSPRQQTDKPAQNNQSNFDSWQAGNAEYENVEDMPF